MAIASSQQLFSGKTFVLVNGS